MPAPYNQTPPYRFGGTDQVSDDLERPPSSAEDADNIAPLGKGREKTCRKGYHVVSPNANSDGGFGTFLYNNPSGEVETLIAGSTLLKRATGSINITYSGSGASQLISLIASEETETIVCTIQVEDEEVFTLDLGVGFDHASIITVDALRVAIDALADFSATVTGPTAHPAAMIHPVFLESFTSGAYTLTFSYETEVNHPTGAPDPFAGSSTNRNDEDFENISELEMNKVIYFTNLYDWPKKYDGVDCYRMGLPAPVLVSVVDSNPGAVGTGGTDVYTHAATFVQVDAQGNEIEGALSNEIPTSISTQSDFLLTIQNILASSGFNTDGAIVAGAQMGVNTITVDDGSGGAHTMKVGQTAYFFDDDSNAHVERLITAVAASTITIAGAPVDVGDNYVISNNLRIRIYRTEADGAILLQVAEIANNSFTANRTYNDQIVDTSLGAAYGEAEVLGVEHGLPPKFKYFSRFKNVAIGLRLEDAEYDGVFSDIDSPEYWPVANRFEDNATNQPITGGSENGPFFWIFKHNGTRQVVGDLTSGQYDISDVSSHIGCEAHATIKHYDNLLFWLEHGSVFASENGSAPFEVGQDIPNFFSTVSRDTTRLPVLKRALAQIDANNQHLLIFVPFETTLGSDVYANDNSTVLMFDVRRREWQFWHGLNMAGGFVINEDELIFTERRYSNFSSTMDYNIHRRHNNMDQFDYVDHNVAIEGYYKSGWFHGDTPSVLKLVEALKVYTNNSIVNANFQLRCRTEINFLKDVTHSDATLDFTGGGDSEGWGIGPWGSFAWGNPAADAAKLFKLVPKDITSIRFHLSFSTFFNQIVLTAWELQYGGAHKKKMVQ